jgi:hypothetical protein
LLSLFRFTKCLTQFISASFEELNFLKKNEIIGTLLASMGKNRENSAYREIIHIFSGEETKVEQKSEEIPQSFMNLVLEKKQKIENCKIQLLLVELMMVCAPAPIKDTTFFDYLPGLHHESELFRCRTLNFIYQHFGDRSLPSILREVLLMNPPPSVLFCGTLGHFFCLNPQAPWGKGLTRQDWDLDKWDRRDGRWLFLQELMGSITRPQFLSLIAEGESREKEKDRKLNLGTPKKAFGLRIERFKEIEANSKRRY